jgi:hypothetical protein
LLLEKNKKKLHDSICKNQLLKKEGDIIMHNNIIEFLKTYFKKNDTENINIDKLIKENCCIEKEKELLLY